MRSAGLVDLQVNGFAGVDFNDAAIGPDDVDRALERMLATGVTACLPAVITATPDRLAARLTALDRAISASRLGPRMIPGYHLEGPFLNPAAGYAGCHPPDAMIPPDADLISRLEAPLVRPLLLVTVAPEIDGGQDFVAAMAAEGRIVAIGHSAADSAVVRRAAAAGAGLSTHLGNGLPQQLHKVNNTLFSQLAEDRLAASIIADGIHLPPDAVKVILRAKGLDRIILVTDAVAAADAPPGLYRFADMTLEHHADGSVREPGANHLAGSALTLDRAVRNLVAWGVATAEQAIAMASVTPRALIAPALARRGIAMPGGTVDWRDDLTVARASL